MIFSFSGYILFGNLNGLSFMISFSSVAAKIILVVEKSGIDAEGFEE